MRKLVVEYKKGFKPSKDTIDTGRGIIMFTPAITEDYWLMRVKVFFNQALVAFPKFGLIGIGFAQESDWNTNLPYNTCAERLYEHIKVNKKYDKLTKATCLKAIKMLQAACKQYEKEQEERTINLNMRDINNIFLGAISNMGQRRIRQVRNFNMN